MGKLMAVLVPIAMISVWLSLATYNIKHQGSLLFYKWRARKEAPISFVLSIICYLVGSAFAAWMLFEVRSLYLPFKL